MEIIKTIYKFDNTQLASGAVVSAGEVEVTDGKVTSIVSGIAIKDDKRITFSMFGETAPRRYSVHSMPEGMDGIGIIKEFINYVESSLGYGAVYSE